jgi:hypothetical protein
MMRPSEGRAKAGGDHDPFLQHWPHDAQICDLFPVLTPRRDRERLSPAR